MNAKDDDKSILKAAKQVEGDSKFRFDCSMAASLQAKRYLD